MREIAADAAVVDRPRIGDIANARRRQHRAPSAELSAARRARRGL